ncbi:MAG: Regulator of ribonuclease [Gaiellales bacterium]|nr:Regulator of ribonuclease [Gaiellales bacterium]
MGTPVGYSNSPRGSRVEQMELVQDPAVADARVLEHLANLGCDPRQERGIRHFIYLPTSDDAASVASTLEREGWDTVIQAAEDIWLVVAGCLRVLDEHLVRETRARLASLAMAHGGAYDGWEAERT